MTKTICFANNKGGSGKSTTCSNVGAALAEMGKRVLLLDGDMQLNLSLSFFEEEQVLALAQSKDNLYYAMKDQKELSNYIISSNYENIDLIPSSTLMSSIEYELFTKWQRELILRKLLKDIKNSEKYDYILIDCPPSLSMLTVNAMTTAHSVLVPIQCEYYALEGLSQLIHTVNLVKERLNPELIMEGVVFTMYDSRTNLSLQVVENVKSNLKQKVYKTIIPRNIRLAEAPSYGKPICLYDAKSVGAESYMNLADEVLQNQ